MLPEGKPENKQMSKLKWVRWRGGLHTQRGMETGSFETSEDVGQR